MPDTGDLEGLVDGLSGALIPMTVLVIVMILALRFARPIVRRVLRAGLERRVASDADRDIAVLEVQKRVDTLESLTVSVTRILIVALVVMIVLVFFDLGAVLAGLGVLLAALAFAGQDVVKDYLMGTLILIENQYYKGDVIRVAGVSGTVEDLSLRRTTLRDLSGEVHIISNGEIRVASNLTRLFARVNLDVEVAYGTDIDRAIGTIDSVGRELAADPGWADRILEPPAVLRVAELGDSGITIKVVGMVRAAEQWAVTGELRRRLLGAFAREGIEIPFPHRVVINRPVDGTAPPTEDVVAAGLGEESPD
jgi:small-conductance mechanosensitive channel